MRSLAAIGLPDVSLTRIDSGHFAFAFGRCVGASIVILKPAAAALPAALSIVEHRSGGGRMRAAAAPGSAATAATPRKDGERPPALAAR